MSYGLFLYWCFSSTVGRENLSSEYLVAHNSVSALNSEICQI